MLRLPLLHFENLAFDIEGSNLQITQTFAFGLPVESSFVISSPTSYCLFSSASPLNDPESQVRASI